MTRDPGTETGRGPPEPMESMGSQEKVRFIIAYVKPPGGGGTWDFERRE